MWHVYALIDPRDNATFYVGLSGDPKRRFRTHLSSRKGSASARVWELRGTGLLPRLETISSHETFTAGRVAEHEAIIGTAGLVNVDRHEPFWPGCARGEPSLWRAKQKSAAPRQGGV